MRATVAGLMTIAVSLLGVARAPARLIASWPDEKLSRFSDLVVVGKLVSTADAAKEIADRVKNDEDLTPILSTLNILYVLKGEHTSKQVIVLHNRLSPQGLYVINGPILMKFQPSEEYVVFLKKGKHGYYEPVVKFDSGLALKRSDSYHRSAEDEPDKLWSDLTDKDAIAVYRTICALRFYSRRAVGLFAKHVKPVPHADPTRLAGLVRNLDSDKYRVRQRATKELQALGPAAEPALRRILADPPSEEVRRRGVTLLNQLAREQWRRSRAIEILEDIGDTEARRLLGTLAQGAPQAMLTVQAKEALERLARKAVVPLSKAPPR
jgi:hypothetical protein